MGIAWKARTLDNPIVPSQSPVVLVNAQADARLCGPLSSADVSEMTSTQPEEPNAEISTATNNTHWRTKSESIRLTTSINSHRKE